MTEIITGKFTYQIFYNAENGYFVGSFKTDSDYGIITVTGIIFDIDFHVDYKLKGSFVEHIKYGTQFKFTYNEKIFLSDEDSLISFFSSSNFKGIGRKTAEKIVGLFKENTLDILKENPDILLQYGFKEKYVDSIKDGISKVGVVSNDLIKMKELGINNQILKIAEEKFKENYIEMIKEKTYFMVRHIRGFSVRIADYYLSNIKQEFDDFSRTVAVFYEDLRNLVMKTGDVYIKLSDLPYYDNMNEILSVLVDENLIVVENELLYLKPLYEAENNIAGFLNFFVQDPEDIDSSFFDLIEKQENKFNIKYDDIQKKAIITFFKENFLIVSGGPGTGKTTITRAMIDIYKEKYPNKKIAVCAPTGRAAKRISELCDVSATTIHRLLKWDKEKDEFQMNEKNPLDIDLLIVDECSMIDIYLFSSLLKSIPYVEKILLIGDKDQLPSVAPGRLLYDLLQVEHIPRIELTTNHRQQNYSGIIQIAQTINMQQQITTYQNVFFIDDFEKEKTLFKIIAQKLEEGYYDFQVLAAMYRGKYGIDNLNVLLQKYLNPASDTKEEIKVGNRIYRKYDKILQLKNLVEENVYNGDIGIIQEIDVKEKTILVNFDDNLVSYTSSNFDNITHGYCISVHKSQGSEYPILFLFLPEEHRYMMEKRLVYTAITRAKKELYIFGNQNFINDQLLITKSELRNSKLSDKLMTWV